MADPHRAHHPAWATSDSGPRPTPDPRHCCTARPTSAAAQAPTSFPRLLACFCDLRSDDRPSNVPGSDHSRQHASSVSKASKQASLSASIARSRCHVAPIHRVWRLCRWVQGREREASGSNTRLASDIRILSGIAVTILEILRCGQARRLSHGRGSQWQRPRRPKLALSAARITSHPSG